jgi:hypothetical protein
MDDRQLQNVWANRQPRNPVATLGGPLSYLMKDRLAKRVRQIGQLAQAWDEVIPEYIREHTALVNYSRGTLTVAVDSAPHRFQLEMLLRAGLTDEIRRRFHAGPLDRVKLAAGPFDFLDLPQRQVEGL